MKKLLRRYLNTFFGKELDLRVKLFHVLAFTGVIICVAMTGVSIAGNMPISTFINFGAGVISLALLIYSAKSGRYRLCYWISILVIFFILFPSLFLSGGGYQGGMPFFFVFAVIFTVYMLDGWGMLLTAAAELVLYSLLCVLAYRRPDIIVPFASEQAVLTDVIIGLVTVSIALGGTMFVQIRMYRSQQRELEQARGEAEAASRAKSAFLANMSHEIRTPIHMLLSMNELIHRESRSAQVQEYVAKIEETGKMLLSLVDSVLDVSKIESGKMELMPEPYESADLLRALALIGKTQCSKKDLNFQFQCAEDLPPMLFGDLPHIRQIASNFLSNAAKYTDSGSVSLTISWEPSVKENEIQLCISVQDTGRGICAQAIPTLFEAFTRVDLPSHRYIEGTGLGLTIVRELTNLMHGTVQVESELGVGSTFSVRIPQTVLERRPASEAAAPVAFHAPDARILVVDDNEGNLSVMKKLLASAQMQVDVAASGAACLQLVQTGRYHVILMDYMMPEMNGLETMEHLKAMPGFDTPVIALTADASAETRQLLLNAGFAAYLAKPILWPRLRQVLLSFLPEELVTQVTESRESCESNTRCWELVDQLQPYGIMLEDALQYFDGNLNDYRMTAELFLRHCTGEMEKVRRFLEDNDCARLRFPIHALKGKARNLGMEQLADVSAHLEELCVQNAREEIQSLLPYLLFLWQRGRDGLALLVQAKKPAEASPDSSAPEIGPEFYQELTRLMREFRRKPSLQAIRQLIQSEPSAEGQQRLQKVLSHVDAIAFDEAQREFDAYLEWKRGASTQ